MPVIAGMQIVCRPVRRGANGSPVLKPNDEAPGSGRRTGVPWPPVTIDAVTILRDALALSEGDRADLAAELLASLPGPEGGLEIDSQDWLREIERRARSVLAGETEAPARRCRVSIQPSRCADFGCVDPRTRSCTSREVKTWWLSPWRTTEGCPRTGPRVPSGRNVRDASCGTDRGPPTRLFGGSTARVARLTGPCFVRQSGWRLLVPLGTTSRRPCGSRSDPPASRRVRALPSRVHSPGRARRCLPRRTRCPAGRRARRCACPSSPPPR